MAHLLARLTDPHQFDLRPTGPGAALEVGCGSAKFPGPTGLDTSADTDADVVHDLDEFPYRLPDASFVHVLMQNVIEHVAEPLLVVAELARISRPEARLHLRTPHFSSALAYGDPTHKHYFFSLAIRQPATPRFAHCSATRLRVVDVTLELWAPLRVLGIAALATRRLELYEKCSAFRFRAMNLRAELAVE